MHRLPARLSPASIESSSGPLAHYTLQDRVPNVKFNAAKILQELAPLSDPPAVSQTIKPCLKDLAADQDGDVRFFAHHALTVCGP